MVESFIPDVPDSKLPYYIEPQKIDFAYFAFKMKDGSMFRQFEQDGDKWIKHHWHEVDFENAEQFEVWTFYFDQYDEPKQSPIFKIKLKPWMKPIFKYHNTQLLDGKSPLTRTARFGIEIEAVNDFIMWEVDKGYVIRSIIVGGGD